MSTTVANSTYRAIGKLYAGMTKESIRIDINAMTFSSEAEREKAYNKQIKLFDYANSLVEGEVDDVISEKEIEAYNRKEKTKKTWKTIGLTALGIGAAVGTYLICKKFKPVPSLLQPKINTSTCPNKQLKTLAEHENPSYQMFEPVYQERHTSYKYVNSTALEDFTPLLNDKIKSLGLSTKHSQGGICLKGRQNIPLGTSGVGDCAVAFMYNTKQNTHALYHAMMVAGKEAVHRENILKIMPEGFDRITIVTGSNPWTAITATGLFNAAKSVNPKALVEFKHSQMHLEQALSLDKLSGAPWMMEYISYNGKVYERPMYINGAREAFKISDSHLTLRQC